MRLFLISVLGFLGLAGAVQACPDWRLDPSYGSYSLSIGQLRQGQSLSLQAGGNNYVWNCPNVNPQTDQGAGYFTSQPDARVFVNNVEGNRLIIAVDSQCDAALLINTGTATWYYDDDDRGNLDPQIILTRPRSGQIYIWVGTYDGQVCNATLRLQAS